MFKKYMNHGRIGFAARNRARRLEKVATFELIGCEIKNT